MGLRQWLRRGPSDADIRVELEAHIAERGAARFGNALQVQEDVRGVWRGGVWDSLWRDLRFTLRAWRRNPGFAVSAVGALALGLGMATALFSVVDRLLFRSLPYPEAERIVSVGLMAPLDTNEFLLGPDYVTLWRETPQPFESTTTFTAGAAPCDLTEQQPERLSCLTVEANLLDFLRVPVLAGRSFTPAEGTPGTPRAALITHGLWLRRFGGRADIEGRMLMLDGKPVPIAGVLPKGFELPLLNNPDVLLPQQLSPPDPARPGPTAFLRGFARLKAGVTVEQAHVALQPLFEQMLKNVPAAFRKEVTLRVRPLRDRQVGDAKRAAWMLLGAVAALLLIACTSVANLLIARTAARERELAIRAALGAGRAQLARLTLLECSLLALIGGALGLGIAQILLKAAVALAPDALPRMQQATVDLRVSAAAFGFALACGIAAGIWPMLAAPATTPLNASRTLVSVRPWVRFTLAAAQIGLTFALLGASALLLRSLWNLQSTQLGMAHDRVVTLSATLGAHRYGTPEQRVAVFERLLESASHIPGTLGAALTDSLPPSGGARGMIYSRIEVEGRPLPAEGTGGMVLWRSVTPNYFEIFRIPVVRGRAFVEDDRRAPEPSMILSESLARRLFPNEDPIGRRLRPGSAESPWHTVVGVAKDVRNAGLTAETSPEYYVARRPVALDAQRQSFLLLRTQAAQGEVAKWLREEMARIDPELPFAIGSMTERVSRLTAGPRFTAWLLSLFAVLALALAAAGLAGVASYLVEQRRREIGVRMALGATAGGVMRQLFTEAGAWAAGGAVLGAALAMALGKVIGSFLHGVTAMDPAAWVAAMAVLCVALAAAVLRPALRAARIDPIAALRE